MIVRTGTVVSPDPTLEFGQLFVARDAVPDDGASRALGARGVVEPDPTLAAALLERGHRGVRVTSTDLFYDPRAEGRRPDSGAQAVDMETATLFALATRRGVQAASVLAVTDLLAGGRVRVDDHELERLGVRLGEEALEALARGGAPLSAGAASG